MIATRDAFGNQLIQSAKNNDKILVLSADLLVGFPTETDKQFEDTLRAVEDLKIAYPHVFPYSERGGTPAARIPNQVPKLIRKERSARIRAVGRRILQDVLSGYIGASGRVLIERSSCVDNDNKHGRLDNYLPVVFSDVKPVVGELIKAQVTGASGETLIARTRSRE